jgi:hypothetical protein
VWAVREALRLLGYVIVAVAIAIVIPGLRAIVTGGDTFWTFRIICLLLGGLYLLLAAGGQGSAASQRVGWGDIFSVAGHFPLLHARPDDPRLSPTAVFVGSGAILLAFGLAL